MDHLHRLPTEILIQILKNSLDLSDLCSLIDTSPRLSSIFNNHAADITETVLKAATLSPIRRVMRIIIYIRAGEAKTREWDDISAHSLPLYNIPPPLLRKFVHLAHRVHVLAHMCLERCLQRCRARGKQASPPSWAEEQRGC